MSADRENKNCGRQPRYRLGSARAVFRPGFTRAVVCSLNRAQAFRLHPAPLGSRSGCVHPPAAAPCRGFFALQDSFLKSSLSQKVSDP